MSQEQPEKLWSGIQISKVIAGTLAAVAAATLGSFLGVAGTLAGAALASVIGSVGTELFNNSLKRGTRTLQTVAPTFIKAPAAVGTPPVAAATEADNPAHTVPDDSVTSVVKPARSFNWKPAVIGAFAVFALALGGISVAEAAMDKTLASAVTGKETSGSSTLSSIGRDSSSSSSEKDEKDPAPAESTEPTGAPEESSDPESGTASPEPGESADPSGTEPATEPTTEPADAPGQTTDGEQGSTPEQDGGDSTQQGTSEQQAPAPDPAATE